MKANQALIDAYEFLRQYVNPLSAKNNGVELSSRFKRILEPKNATNPDWLKAAQAWKTIYENARTEGDAIGVFLGLPDTADNQPFTGISGGRRILDPCYVADKYQELARSVDEISKFLTQKNIRQLLADQANDWCEVDRLPRKKEGLKTIEHAKSASELWQTYGNNFGSCRQELLMLRELLLGANPHRWYISRNLEAVDVNKQAYVKLVAQLNRGLKKPQHAALATLANRNLQANNIEITGEAVRKAWAAYTRTKEGEFFKS